MVYVKRCEQCEDVDMSGQLFDTVKTHLGFSSDLKLATWLDVAPSTVSKIRHGIFEVNDSIILRIHETLEWPVKRIRSLIGSDPA